MGIFKIEYTVELSDIPNDIIDWDEYVEWQEANNYSSYDLYIEDWREITPEDYSYRTGGFLGLEGQELIDKWKQVREWLTSHGIPESVDRIIIKVWW